MKIKVCGLTQPDQIKELISMEIDFLGFIFYPKSPRFVLNHLTLQEIGEFSHLRKVGVFVNESINGIVEIAAEAKLNSIQLHGDETEEFILKLRAKLGEDTDIIKAIRIGNQTAAELQKTVNQLPATLNYLLFDTDSKTYGGTGATFNWNLLNEIEISKPYFLSGGISPENINQIPTLNHKPFAVDINSKFESEAGIKDLQKIKKFKTLLDEL